jgi:hypothetical protein
LSGVAALYKIAKRFYYVMNKAGRLFKIYQIRVYDKEIPPAFA